MWRLNTCSHVPAQSPCALCMQIVLSSAQEGVHVALEHLRGHMLAQSAFMPAILHALGGDPGPSACPASAGQLSKAS